MTYSPASSIRGGSRRHIVAFVLTTLILGLSPSTQAASRYEQRADYRRALDHLTAGRMQAFRSLRSGLEEYALLPYLDYYELRSRLSSASAKEVLGFRAEHADLPVADIVYYRWLKRLGSQRHWRTFLDNYQPSTDPELRCYHLRALYGTGKRKQALDRVADLWLSATSRPKACDPLFETWIHHDRLTESMVWQRLSLALAANSTTLARYLQRYFVTPTVKAWAQSYYNVHVSPATISQTSRFSADNRYSREVIRHGLERLAARDPEAAGRAWLIYQDSHDFDPEDAHRVETAVLLGHARVGHFPGHDLDPARLPAEAFAKAALAHENWSELKYWIEHLPADMRGQRVWQYWLARALDATTLVSDRARLTFASLAKERDYYGFLAAERTGKPVMLNHQPLPAGPGEIDRLRRLPGAVRAAELLAVGDDVNARREWYRLLPTLDPREKAAAAALAFEMGWTSQGIRTAGDSALRDALDLRFPVAYRNDFLRVSHITAVPASFLLGIARQESLFDPRARSTASARGLMQLMHPTAERVARRVGLSEPGKSDLYDPALNIELGGHHLASLLARYQQRRPLAAAAYNAGERRVDRWIREASGRWMDVWIESIPLQETRNYVKNVLAFTRVYGVRTGQPGLMLEAHEMRLP